MTAKGFAVSNAHPECEQQSMPEVHDRIEKSWMNGVISNGAHTRNPHDRLQQIRLYRTIESSNDRQPDWFAPIKSAKALLRETTFGRIDSSS